MDWNQLADLDLTVYSTPWCGDCRRLKKVLAEKKIDYAEIDIDADADAAAELHKATGRTAIPFVKLPNFAFVRGWHDEAAGKWDETTFLREMAQALDR